MMRRITAGAALLMALAGCADRAEPAPASAPVPNTVPAECGPVAPGPCYGVPMAGDVGSWTIHDVDGRQIGIMSR